jgi:dihydrodipicolinate synthase/N-acetylneuraminate lyase
MYSSMIYVFPRAMRRIYDLARESRCDAALPLQHALNAFFVEAIEPLLEAGYIDGALDKAIAQAAGFIKGSRSMRPPYEGVSDEHMEHLQRVIDKYRPQLES